MAFKLMHDDDPIAAILEINKNSKKSMGFHFTFNTCFHYSHSQITQRLVAMHNFLFFVSVLAISPLSRGQNGASPPPVIESQTNQTGKVTVHFIIK